MATELSKCHVVTPLCFNLDDYWFNDGWDWYFKEFVTEYTDAIQGSANSNSLRNLYGYIFFGNDRAIDVINNSDYQVGPIITMTVFGLLGFLSVLVLVYLLKNRLCTTNQLKIYRKETHVSQGVWALQAVVYISLFVFMVVGMVLFGFAMSGLGLPLQQAGLEQNNNFIQQANSRDTSIMNCYSKSITAIFHNTAEANLDGTDDIVDIWTDANGVESLRTFDQITLNASYSDLERQTATLIGDLQTLQKSPSFGGDHFCYAEMEILQSQLSLIVEAIVRAQELMYPIMFETNVTLSDALPKDEALTINLEIHAMYLNLPIQQSADKINVVLNSTSNVALIDNSISSHLTDFLGTGANNVQLSPSYTITIIFTYLFVYIPSVIVVLAILSAFLVSVYSVIIYKYEIDPKLRTARLLMYIGSYTVFATVWYLFVLVIVILWLSSAFSASCPVVYFDENFRFYQSANDLQFTNFAGENLTMDYSLYRRQQTKEYEHTVFNTINQQPNEPILTAIQVMNYLNVSQYLMDSNVGICYSDLSVSFDKHLANNYTEVANLLKIENEQLNSSTDFTSCPNTTELNHFIESLSKFRSNLAIVSANTTLLQNILNTVADFEAYHEDDTRDYMISNNTFKYQQVQRLLNSTVNELLILLNTDVWQNADQIHLYDNSGSPICNGVRYSLNELWGSIFWIAIIILPTGFLLRYTAGKLEEIKNLDQTLTLETTENEARDSQVDSPAVSVVSDSECEVATQKKEQESEQWG